MISGRRACDRDEPGERPVRFHVSPAKAQEARAVASSGRSEARPIIRFWQTAGGKLRGLAMHICGPRVCGLAHFAPKPIMHLLEMSMERMQVGLSVINPAHLSG